MAAASNYSPSKPAAGDSSAAIHSPHRRSPAPSPWTQVVRGPHEAEQIATSADLPDDLAQIQAEGGADGGAANSKKPAWNKPSNGAAEVGTVMGAELWPALSESARASPKSSSSDSPKPPLDGFVTLPQGTGIVHPSSHNQLMMNNAHPSLALPNHVIPTRQKSMKRGGGGGGGGSGSGSSSGHNIVNGGFSQQPPSPHIPPADVPPNISAKSEPAVTELSPRDHAHKESGQRGVGSQSRSANEHIHRSDSFKKGNGGTHPRSDGSHHHNFGGRGNQDRGNHEWNSQRSFNGRDSHLQSQRASPRGFRPPNHSPTPFIHPSPVAIRPYPMVYPDVPPQVFFYAPSPESLRGVPFVGPISPHGMIYAGPDPQLIARIVHQIDYYFSNENLVKDTYLRNNMDDQGWVPVQLIASFKKMSMLTENIQLILDAVRTSNVLEVQGDKIRRREDWSRWIMPTAQSPNVSSPQAQGRSNHEMLIAKAQSLSLEENPIYHSQIEASFSRSSSGDFSQSQAPGQATVGGGSERTVSVRNPSE